MSSWLPAVIASCLGFGAAYLSYRQSTRASAENRQVEFQRVDAAAYERAKSLYESGISQLEEQLARLRVQVNQERVISNNLRQQVNDLERTVARLRRQLIAAGIDVEAYGNVERAEQSVE
jgi:septal ring factor EnvC (AmiA/AmiB activator)